MENFNDFKNYIIKNILAILPGVVATFIFWSYKPNGSVSNIIFFGIMIPLIYITAAAIIFAVTSYNKHKVVLPKILSISGNSILLEKSELFATDSMVSFYFKDGEFEKYMGYGFVESIQIESKRIQIKVEHIDEVWKEKLKDKNRSNIFIKPFPYKWLLEYKGEKNNDK